MQKTARDRGGRWLSKEYINNITKLKWECAKGHRWWTTPMNIWKGAWCPECGRTKNRNTKPLTIEEMKEMAKTRGGDCISKFNSDSGTVFLWECSDGHRWASRLDNVKWGSWCPVCAGRKWRWGRNISIDIQFIWIIMSSHSNQLKIGSAFSQIFLK